MKRKGSFVLVLILGPIIVHVIVSMLVVASQLYTTSRDSSRMYERYQSCYAVSELSCYQYILDLCAVNVTQDLSSRWISSAESALYSQALDLIVKSIGAANDQTRWHITTAESALAAMDVSDSSVLVPLMGEVTGIRQELEVRVQYPLMLNWDDEGSWEDREASQIKLDPFYVDVTFSLRGDMIQDRFYVDNLYLSLEQLAGGDIGPAPGETEGEGDEEEEEEEVNLVRMAIVEGEGGVVITREVLEDMSEE